MKIGSMFSGIGGLDLACEAHFGATTAWQIEQAAFPRSILARHFPHADRSVTDCADVDAVAALEPVDVICGGFPCQDIAVCGKGAGLSGSRSGLFYSMTAVVDRMRPRWVVFENSPILWSKHRVAVEAELSRIGYGSTWSILAASEVGAPHRRKRAFVLCERGAAHVGQVERGKLPAPHAWPTPTATFCDPADVAAWQRRRVRNLAKRINGNGQGTPLGVAVRAWSTPTTQDAKNNAGPSQKVRNSDPLNVQAGGRLNPAWVVALVGYPDDWVEATGAALSLADWRGVFPAAFGGDALDWEPPRVVPSSFPGRVARLRALGNCVVPAQAIEALRRLSAGPKQSTLWDLL